MTRRRRQQRVGPVRCVLDGGGLSALTRPSTRARAWLRWIVEHDGMIVVPTPTLVETTTGDGRRDAEVNRVLAVLSRASAALLAPDEGMARRAGALRYAAGTDDGVDALVAAAAVGDGSPCVLLTSGPDDLGRLLANEPQVAIRPV